MNGLWMLATGLNGISIQNLSSFLKDLSVLVIYVCVHVDVIRRGQTNRDQCQEYVKKRQIIQQNEQD